MITLIFSLLIGASWMATAATADGVKAEFGDNMQIVLPADQPLQAVYTIDISGLFSNEGAANQFFGMFTENVVHYVVHFDENYVEVHLHSYADPAWTMTQWNDYFAARSVKMKAVYESL